MRSVEQKRASDRAYYQLNKEKWKGLYVPYPQMTEAAKKKKRVKARKRWARHRDELRRRQSVRDKTLRRNPATWLQVNLKYIKQRAKERQLECTFNPTKVSIPEFCPVLGMRLIYGASPCASRASLDRIDGTKGYVDGNVRIISDRANRLKSDGDIEEFKAIIRYLEEHSMPELLQGVSHHVSVTLEPGHPDGEIRLWLKGKIINMTPEEARSLADVLVDHASRAGAPELGTTLTPTPPPPVTPPPAPELPDDDSELPDDDSEFDEVA